MLRHTNDLDDCTICLGAFTSVHSECHHALIIADFDLAYADKFAGCLHATRI